MGEIKISYLHDPKTGRREIWIDYEAASDWMPAEHERRHKEIVRSLLAQGIVSADQIDRFHVRVEGQEIRVEEMEDSSLETPQATKE